MHTFQMADSLANQTNVSGSESSSQNTNTNTKYKYKYTSQIVDSGKSDKCQW